MKWSQSLIPTLKETPEDAEAISHKLMLRAGLIRKLASGTYTYLPLGWKILKKVTEIVRQEMNASGAQEVHLCAIQPTDLWKESGRLGVFGEDLIQFTDRHKRTNILGPTHEEVITDLARKEIHSYKQLPMNLYQIQTKFRDELRPRSGVIRCREFLMKDAYSFHADQTCLDKTYEHMRQTYLKIFKRLSITTYEVKADPGAMGGGDSLEFVLFSSAGEDRVIKIGNTETVLAQEMAKRKLKGLVLSGGTKAGGYKRVHTPDHSSIESVSTFLDKKPEQILKSVIYNISPQKSAKKENFIIVFIRGDHDVSDFKIKEIYPDAIQATPDEINEILPGSFGYTGPIGNPLKKYIDEDVLLMKAFAAGANEKDHHLTDVEVDDLIDESSPVVGDFRKALEGDKDKETGVPLTFQSAIELGHIFKLNTRYSESMGAKALNAQGKEMPLVMGCYGIGVSRLVAAIIEEHHDDKGIAWPARICPHQVVITSVNVKDEETMRVSEDIYQTLIHDGFDVLWDDRAQSAGFKFKDADLVGFPVRIVISPKNLAEGKIEIFLRKDKKQHFLPKDEALSLTRNHLTENSSKIVA